MAPTKILSNEGLSEYERLRLAKIARNNEYLQSLGLEKETIINSISSHNKKRTRIPKTNNSNKYQMPRRSSKRIKNAKAQVKIDDEHVDFEIVRAKKLDD